MVESFGNPLISVIILNWNSNPYVHKCIDSLLNQSYKNFEVIFVDNNSTDSSLLECKSKYCNFTFVENKENIGFAAGMNSGLKHVNGKYCLLLNTDVYLDKNYLEECMRLLEHDNEVSCTAGYEYKWDYPNLTDRKVGHGTYGIALHLRIVDTKNNDGYVFGVSGSFPFYRVDVIKEVIKMRGYFFDEIFETGWEDTELRFLFILLGKKTTLCKTTKAWHIGSAADNGNTGVFEKNLEYQKRIFRNRLYIIHKYIYGIYKFWYTYIFVMNLFVYFYILLFHSSSLTALSKAKKEYNANSPLIKKQKELIEKYPINGKKDLLKYIAGL